MSIWTCYAFRIKIIKTLHKIYIFLHSIVFLLLLSLCIFHIYQLNEFLLLFAYISDILYYNHQVCLFLFLHLNHCNVHCIANAYLNNSNDKSPAVHIFALYSLLFWLSYIYIVLLLNVEIPCLNYFFLWLFFVHLLSFSFLTV